MKTAQSIVERIAPNEQTFLDSLFNPVTFSDGSTGTYNGHIVKRYKTHVRFTWSRHEGKTYYSYTLDPFGEDVGYRTECEAANLIYKMGA